MGTGGGRGGGAGVVFGGGTGGEMLATATGGTVNNLTGVSVSGSDVVIRNSGGESIRLNPTQQRSFLTSASGQEPRANMLISQPTRGPNGVYTRVSGAQREQVRRAIDRRRRADTGRSGGNAP